MIFKKFRIDQLFTVDTSNTYGSNLKDSEIIDDEGTTPYVGNIITNNGISGYSRYEANNEGNAITLSDTVTSVYDTIYYQKDSFIGKSHVQVLRPIMIENQDGEEEQLFLLNEKIALYIITCMKKSVKTGEFDYGTKFNSDAIKETLISLPVNDIKDNLPNFDYMEKYIQNITPKYYELLDSKVEKIRMKNEEYKTMIKPFVNMLIENE
ncbi:MULTISPECIES: hypothetical protein [Lachnospiraceae]|uniref:hypothetical protein n=1 Tax=Lachnospiraceae TaxID=186803 RepID=UPI0022E5C7D4|nr:hypothetical protein [Blautia intestinalis]